MTGQQGCKELDSSPENYKKRIFLDKELKCKSTSRRNMKSQHKEEKCAKREQIQEILALEVLLIKLKEIQNRLKLKKVSKKAKIGYQSLKILLSMPALKISRHIDCNSTDLKQRNRLANHYQ